MIYLIEKHDGELHDAWTDDADEAESMRSQLSFVNCAGDRTKGRVVPHVPCGTIGAKRENDSSSAQLVKALLACESEAITSRDPSVGCEGVIAIVEETLGKPGDPRRGDGWIAPRGRPDAQTEPKEHEELNDFQQGWLRGYEERQRQEEQRRSDKAPTKLDAALAAMPAHYGPDLDETTIPESSDVVESCSNCHREQDEPHTWEECAKYLAAEVERWNGMAHDPENARRILRDVAASGPETAKRVRCWQCKSDVPEGDTICFAGVGTQCRDSAACRERRRNGIVAERGTATSVGGEAHPDGGPDSSGDGGGAGDRARTSGGGRPHSDARKEDGALVPGALRGSEAGLNRDEALIRARVARETIFFHASRQCPHGDDHVACLDVIRTLSRERASR